MLRELYAERTARIHNWSEIILVPTFSTFDDFFWICTFTSLYFLTIAKEIDLISTHKKKTKYDIFVAVSISTYVPTALFLFLLGICLIRYFRVDI